MQHITHYMSDMIDYVTSLYATKENILTMETPLLATELKEHPSKYENDPLFEIIDINENVYVKPFFDMDWDEEDHPNFAELRQNEHQLVQNAINYLSEHFYVCEEDIAISHSKYTHKISYHLIICTLAIKYKHLIEFKNKHRSDFKALGFDDVVYRRFGKMRLVGTSKVGKRSPLLPITHTDDWTKHFITNVEGLPHFSFETSPIDETPISTSTTATTATTSNDEVLPPPKIPLKLKRGKNIVEAEAMIDLLSMQRADNYGTWTPVGMILKTWEEEYPEDSIRLWIKFSQKSPKFNMDECLAKWNTFNPNGKMTIASLYYYARIDNPEGYRKVKNIDQLIMRSLSCTHTDCAKVAHGLYEHVFKYVGSKKWYYFEPEEHRWKLDNDGFKLKERISNDMVERYTEFINSLDASEENLSAKKGLNKLSHDFRDVTFKNKIMKEAEILFYDPSFESKLDSNPDLWVCENGIVILSKQELRDGEPSDYVFLSSHRKRVQSLPGDPIKEEVWNFLRSIQPEASQLHFLMKMLSGDLQGSNPQQKFSIWTGIGGNGKSKLLELHILAMGDYAKKIPVALLTKPQGSGESASPQLADCRGKRLIHCSEPEEGTKFNLAFIKELTGNDKVTCRKLYGSPTEFIPQFKVRIICNDTPTANANDQGFRRRVLIVEFTQKFVDNPCSPNEQKLDLNLSDKFPLWADAYLSILLDYYPIYLSEGLIPPPSVMASTGEYLESVDTVQLFIDEYIVRSDQPNDFLRMADLFEKFKKSPLYNRDIGSRNLKKILQDKLNIKCMVQSTVNGKMVRSFFRGIKWVSNEPNNQSIDDP